jgi:DMSO/TMAO reductase YedYZ molybdopterin-dependent catalytic subunit
MSRRAMLGSVAAASGILFLQGIGQSVGGPLRHLAFLLPRGATRPQLGPLGFPVNRTWAITKLKRSVVADGTWQLTLTGQRKLTLTRAQLLAMPQHTYDLPIACVEGWSTTQRWTGVRMHDLAALVGSDGARVSATSVSLAKGTYGQATLGHEQVHNPQTLLALKVNGLTLPLDHGFPARVISPAIPGVHCTKWVSEIQFDAVPA